LANSSLATAGDQRLQNLNNVAAAQQPQISRRGRSLSWPQLIQTNSIFNQQVSKAEDALNTAKGVIYSGPLSSMDLRWDF
uniref:SCP domain-containing protein n=1 Tax=Macrostomum lignano TaxID=282301 RepID=A0A1I8GQN1_9PLAT